MKKYLLALAVLALAPTTHAATDIYAFETETARNFSSILGKGSEGSTLDVSREQPHSGRQSLKISYQSSGGWIEFITRNSRELSPEGNTLYLSFWVYGAGKSDFNGGGLRLQDSNGEAFQFDLPEFAQAIGGEGWRRVTATIDLSKARNHWGATSDGVLDRPFHWFGLAATRSSQTPASGTFYIDDFVLSDQPIANEAVVPAVAPLPPRPQPQAVLTLSPVTAPLAGNASAFLKWIVPPGQPAVFRATVNSGETNQILSWKVRDAFDTVLAGGDIPLAGGAKDVELNVPNPPRGVLYLTASLRNGQGKVLAEADTRAAVFSPRERPVSLTPFVWGIAAHMGGIKASEADSELAVARMIGFSACRFDQVWHEIQPAPGVWNWETPDRIYAALQRERIMPLPLLGYGTRWATTGDPDSKDWHQWANTPPRIEPFVQFARESVKRYGHATHYWELWNEPDIDFWLGSSSQYTALVDAVLPAIKAEDPQAIVMNGGFTATNRRPDFIPHYLKSVKSRPDILAFHTHMQFENMLRAEGDIKGKLQAAGWTGPNRPQMWLNESGYSSAHDSQERIQAIQLVKKMAYATAAGLTGFVCYDLRDDGTDPDNIEHHFGLVRRDFAPKAASAACRELLNNLGGREFSGRLALDKDSYLLTHRGAGASVLTSWMQSQNESGALKPLLVKVSGAANVSLERHDIFGNVFPVPVRHGAFLLNLTDVPQYIVAHDETVHFQLAQNKGALLDAAPAVVLTAGQTSSWPVKVSNPFPSQLQGYLKVNGTAPVSVDVAPNTTRVYDIALRRDDASGSREKLHLSLESPLLPAPLQAASEIQMAYIVPPAPETLQMVPQGLVSLFEATPMQALHFKGTDDLSATAQLQNTPEGIQVRITVNDQTHFVSSAPGTWWQGDSVQWAIGLPDGRMWEWTAALLPDGPHMVQTLAPDHKIGATMPVTIQRAGNRTIYQWTLPRTLSGGTPLPNSFGFNFLVNDSDGADRKGWLELTPGIGHEKKPSAFAPLIVQGP